jgi:hypothetical protein
MLTLAPASAVLMVWAAVVAVLALAAVSVMLTPL